ncbi:acetate kinase [Patescibacteria group bacterium]|nr:acetate kinase [Patescibacteria group bacterium]
MYTLVLNAGSSSLRYTLFNSTNKPIYKGHVDAIGLKNCHFRRYLDNGIEKTSKMFAKNHEEAISYALKRLISDKAIQDLKEIKKVGHRVVHGGEEFTKPTLLISSVIKKLKKLSELAPLHNPANVAAVLASRSLLPKAKHYAVFDTAFHSTLPQKAFLYGLPFRLYKKEHIRRYGFHGTSHNYVAKQAARLLKKPSAKLITCHLGNGVSLTAVKNGKSVDTSMGFTPLEGPIMGTRSGTIDPAIIFHLAKKRPLEKIHHLLEKESGFLGMSEISSDIRKLRANPKAAGTTRTYDLLSYQLAKLICSYFAPLGGLPDAIVFTAGIGEHAFYIRKLVCEYLRPFGVNISEKANKDNSTEISTQSSKIRILIIKTDEELEIAKSI